MPPRQRGFTLIELIAAFVVFALGFGVLMQILSSCLHTTAQSADYTRAALWAQSLLDTQGVGEPLQEGDYSGRFDDKFSWRLRIGKIDPPEPIAAVGGVAPGNSNAQAMPETSVNAIDLYQLELVVSWGSYYMTHNARFVTLRSINPAAINTGIGNAGPTRGGQGNL
ncbi:MAG TPA: prepilin-type N-terminal cleavage/methylation domain-containing protein [Rudaea sp.]|nr:prepilin-type N-terminal cleavage/methylation domain-containing protein [Rudaea sp.]